MDESDLPKRILQNFDFAALAEIALVIVASTLAVMLIERLVPRLVRRLGVRVERSILPFLPLVRLVIIVAAIVLIVPVVIKPTVQNLIAVTGAMALALGFALKDYISSVIAGIVAMFERPYRRHDWITFDGAYGEVRDLGFRAVQLVTLDDTVVTVPHGKLWDSSVYNANDGSHTLQCIADFYLMPDHDAARVRDRLRDVALTSAWLALERPVQVVLHEQPWGTHYRLKAYPVDATDQLRFTTDLTVRGKAELLALGCRFAVLPAVSGPDLPAAAAAQVGRGGTGD